MEPTTRVSVSVSRRNAVAYDESLSAKFTSIDAVVASQTRIILSREALAAICCVVVDLFMDLSIGESKESSRP